MAEYRPFEPLGDFVDGRFALPAHPAGEIALEDPGDLAAGLGAFPFAPEALDEAVAAARRAWPGWRDTPLEQRASLLRRLAEALRASVRSRQRATDQAAGAETDRGPTPSRPIIPSAGRVAQWESARLTRERSLVRNQPRPCLKQRFRTARERSLGPAPELFPNISVPPNTLARADRPSRPRKGRARRRSAQARAPVPERRRGPNATRSARRPLRPPGARLRRRRRGGSRS